jgi:hypothetical protein
MLDQAVRLLFDTLGYHPDSEPLMLELSDAMFGSDGRPTISRTDLVPSHLYTKRYAEILSTGYAWVNLSFVGNLDGTPIITVELPHETRGTKQTSVNISGPPRAVIDANLDAAAFLKLSGD